MKKLRDEGNHQTNNMRIKRLALLKGVLEARGITVIIDVFRAFTCEPLLYYYGVTQIILESDIDTCRAMKGNYICIGENNEVPIEGFDLTNSPSLIMKKGGDYFKGKKVIHRTTSGVPGAINAFEHSDEVLLASFVNARATAEYVKKHNPELVSIVAMGARSRENAIEDDYWGYAIALERAREKDSMKDVKKNFEPLIDFLRFVPEKNKAVDADTKSEKSGTKRTSRKKKTRYVEDFDLSNYHITLLIYCILM